MAGFSWGEGPIAGRLDRYAMPDENFVLVIA
jgi:hypothetical protein